MAEEEAKSADHINLCVKSQDGSQIYFKVRRSTPFQKVRCLGPLQADTDTFEMHSSSLHTAKSKDRTPAP